MMFCSDSPTGAARSAIAAGTTRMDRRRLLRGYKRGGGKGAKGGKPESARKTGLAGDVAKRRKVPESAGKSFLRPYNGTKVFSGARIAPPAAAGLLTSRAQRGTFTAAAHCLVMQSPRRAVGDWQNASGNCGNSRDASRQGFVSTLGNLQVGNRLAVAEIAEIGRRVCAPVRPRPRCLTGVGAAPILPHRKNGLKSRKHKAF